MNCRFLGGIGVAILSLLAANTVSAQENPAKRLASIVGVAVEEYAKAVDDNGKVISKDEFDETTGFLSDAREIATRLNSYNAPAAQAVLDSIISVVSARKPPAAARELYRHFAAALGTAGAMDLPKGPLDIAEGHQLFAANCASCHGMTGAGDGPAAHTLSTAPPPIGVRSQSPELTPTLAYNVISVGVRGTSMPAFASTLTPQQRWNVINYIYSLRHEQLTLPVARADATAIPGDTASPVIMALLDSALDFARSGKAAEAGDRAFDAYIAFEPLETSARAKKPGLVATMEKHFADFKGAVRRSDLSAAKQSRDAIADGLPSIIDLTQNPSSAWEAFFQSFLIILREGFEAILVIGAVVAFLIKMGHRERLHSIWLGIVLGVVASLATAVVLKTLLGAMPASREIVEAATMLVAVVVLFSVSYWLISKVEAAKWQKFIREKVTMALEHGGGKALALVSFLAVYREGAETALFYQALFNEGPNVGVPLALGIVVGLGVLAIIFTLFYRYGVKIPMRPFFTVTSLLLYYMAFVFMGKGIRELQEGNIMPITVIPGGPHVEAMGIYPSVQTLTAQAILIVLLLFAIVKTFWPRQQGAEEAA
ncbi:MAG TPA: cytochrome c/FTR1 family iron permease [Gemmatimonadaceae bacterium]|nr:cytochrome c/FTR1 family iron permease [Gemmatimonadaceae bacterium]